MKCSTVPTGQLNGSSWWSLHHEVKTFHFKALWSGEWSQQPRLRDRSLWAGPPQRPSPQFPQFWLGVKYRALCLGQKVPPDGELQRRPVEKGYTYIWEPYSARLPRAMRSSRTRSRRTLSRTPGSRAIGENAHRQSLGHVCTITSSPFFREAGMREREPEWTMRLHSTDPLMPPYHLHHLGVEPLFPGPQSLSRQDICSNIVGPWDVSYSKRQQLPLGPQEDLARQFAKWTWPQTPLVIYVGDHRCVVWVEKHMVAPEICQEFLRAEVQKLSLWMLLP